MNGAPLGQAQAVLELLVESVQDLAGPERLLGVLSANGADGEPTGHQAVAVECAPGASTGLFSTATQAASLAAAANGGFSWDAEELSGALNDPASLEYGMFEFRTLFEFSVASLAKSGVSSSQGSYYGTAGGFSDVVAAAASKGEDEPASSSTAASGSYNLVLLTERHLLLTTWQGDQALTVVGYKGGAGFGKRTPAAPSSYLPAALGVMTLVCLNLYRSRARRMSAMARRQEAKKPTATAPKEAAAAAGRKKGGKKRN